MTQRWEMYSGKTPVLPWLVAGLAMIAGTTLFGIAGAISFGLAEADATTGPWVWLAGGGVLLAVAGFLLVLLLASNVLIRRQRASILPTARLR